MIIEVRRVNDYGKLFDAIANYSKYDSELVIDLSGHSFIKPIGILAIVQTIIFFRQKNLCTKIIKPNNSGVANYINQIGLMEFCEKNYESSTTLNAITSQTAMPLRRIDRNNMNAYIESAKNYFMRFCPGKDLTMLDVSISELINNSYDHSESEIDAYIFCQYYPKTNQIIVSVSDLGIGIPGSVNRFLRKNNKSELPDTECILWALELNKSVQSKTYNKGLGLDNLLSFTKSTNAYLRIISNHAFYYDGQYRFHSIKNFKGTMVEVQIKINELDDIENSYFDLW